MKGSGSIIGQRLREARLRAGLSQKALGIQAGIDEFTASPRVNQYERGKHTPEFQTVERFAEVLGVPTPYFYCRDEALAVWILRFSGVRPPQKSNKPRPKSSRTP